MYIYVPFLFFFPSFSTRVSDDFLLFLSSKFMEDTKKIVLGEFWWKRLGTTNWLFWRRRRKNVKTAQIEISQTIAPSFCKIAFHQLFLFKWGPFQVVEVKFPSMLVLESLFLHYLGSFRIHFISSKIHYHDVFSRVWLRRPFSFLPVFGHSLIGYTL